MSDESTSNQEASINPNSLIQWVTSVLNVETTSETSLDFLNSVLGPLKTDPSLYTDKHNEAELEGEEPAVQVEFDEPQNAFTHQMVLKIDEQVFVEKIDIYEKVKPGSCLLKIEALETRNPDSWFKLWENVEHTQEKFKTKKIFSPEITPSPFRTDTIRVKFSGNLYLIEAIEIKGNKLAVETETKPDSLSLLSQHLRSLVLNEMFADVYFEVEGKLIPAHRNILVSRSEYFRAMLSSHSLFKESIISDDASKDPIYVRDISYGIFVEVLNFLYTGHVSSKIVPFNILIGVMRAADKMNLIELDKLCLFHLSEIVSQDNVIKIFKEASETPDILKHVVQMCYDVLSVNFAYASRTEDFCSLQQELMVKVLENVVPKLCRLSSVQVNGNNDAGQAQPEMDNVEVVNRDNGDSDSEED